MELQPHQVFQRPTWTSASSVVSILVPRHCQNDFRVHHDDPDDCGDNNVSDDGDGSGDGGCDGGGDGGGDGSSDGGCDGDGSDEYGCDSGCGCDIHH